MTWLRIDDGFASHPKIGKLSDRDFRVWMRVLCHCARYEDPTVDEATMAEVKDLTSQRIARYRELGLLDRSGRSFEVHDWVHYLPKDKTGADRQAKWRARRGESEAVREMTAHLRDVTHA